MTLGTREENLKNTIARAQAELACICRQVGHDLKTTHQARKEISGSHMETHSEIQHYEDCFHNCHCPVVKKQRTVMEYVVVRTHISRCERCGETTTRETREPYSKWSGL